MKPDARLLTPLLAIVLLAIVVQQTVGALRRSGPWAAEHASAPPMDPYVRLERLLASRPPAPDPAARDPFGFGRATGPVAVRRPRPAPAPAETAVAVARPVLTAILWAAEPSASIRWNDHDYSVRVNSLFDEFRVRSISRDQVVLERGSDVITLQLPRKGDQ